MSRVSDERLLTNVVVGVRGREGQKRRQGLEDGEIKLSRSLTSFAFKTASEFRCNGARAAFDDALGRLDPLAFPSGSTNTVWEHIVYTGTTNGAFVLPSSTASAAVLRVAVSGSGRGELLVGNRAVPLAGGGGIANTISHGDTGARSGGTVLDRINRIDRINTAALTTFENSNPVNLVNPVKKGACLETPSLRASVSPCETSAQHQILLPITRGRTVPLYLRVDATLAVAFSSDDFAFGVLPDHAASRLSGRINFPNVAATTPCLRVSV